MSQRGRGCLEIRPSDSAFYRTTTSEIGDRPEKYYDTRELMNGNTEESETLDDNIPTPQSFAFLYTRESDKIGSKVRKDGVNANLQMTLSNTRRGRSKTSAFASQAGTMSSVDSANQKTDEILLSYKQGTKVEDPRFTTSSNEYGKKAPTMATFVSQRSSRPQGFSKSFQNITPKNTSLNTSMTKSNVHPNLDPQFA